MPKAEKSAGSARNHSLNEQIDDVAQRLVVRRNASASKSTLLKQRIRKKLGSPVALLIAGGVGLVVAHFATARSKTPKPQAASTLQRLLTPAVILQVVSLAGSVIAMRARHQTEKPPAPQDK